MEPTRLYSMKNIIIDGLSVKDADNGKNPLVFVHAFPLSSEMWDNQLSFFSSDYRVIAYDVRGLGNSAQNDNQFMMDTHADDLLKIILHLNLQRVNAVGLSMGGYIIQKALLKKTELFNTIVLADTRLERDSNEGLDARASAIKKIKSGQRKEFIDPFVNNLVAKENLSNEGLMNKIKSIIDRNTDEGICGSLLALATRTDNSGAFKNFELPVLVMVGEKDVLTPVDSALKIKDEFLNSLMHIIKGSGHLSNLENPVEFNSIINSFLSQFNK